MVKGAVAPEKPLSFDHWMNSLGVGTLAVGGVGAAMPSATTRLAMPSVASTAITESAVETPVIGKMTDMKRIGKNEYRVADLLPDMGNPKANWKQNSGVLRSIMKQGNPMRDVSLFDSGLDPMLGIVGTENANTFLQMERNLLYEHGWRYSNGFWTSP
jgi:hypothetical protein